MLLLIMREKERGNISIREFRMTDVQLIVNEASNDSVTASINILSVLKQMFNVAYENDLIKKILPKAFIYPSQEEGQQKPCQEGMKKF